MNELSSFVFIYMANIFSLNSVILFYVTDDIYIYNIGCVFSQHLLRIS